MRIAFVHAHPDDESLWSGALTIHLVDQGHEVWLLTATRGERGEVVLNREQPGRQTGRLTEELMDINKLAGRHRR